MSKKQKEKLSLLIDGENVDSQFIEEILYDEEYTRCWHRYHVAKSAIKGEKIYSCSLNFDISEQVAKAIDNEILNDQPIENSEKPTNLFWIKTKDIFGKVGQVGLAACITLGIITSVQYYQNSSDNNSQSVLNTVPIGINVSPVGMQMQDNKQPTMVIDQSQYNKIHLLVRDYELQKRLVTN